MINTKFALPLMAEQWFINLPDKYRLLYLHIIFKADSSGIAKLDPDELKKVSADPKLDFGHFLEIVNSNEERFIYTEEYSWLCKDYFRLTFGPVFNPRSNNQIGYMRLLIHHKLPLNILQVDMKGFTNLSQESLEKLAAIKNKDILEQIFLTGDESLIEQYTPASTKRKKKSGSDFPLSVEQMVQLAQVFKMVTAGSNVNVNDIEKALQSQETSLRKPVQVQSIDNQSKKELKGNVKEIDLKRNAIDSKVELHKQVNGSTSKVILQEHPSKMQVHVNGNGMESKIQSNGTVIQMPVNGHVNDSKVTSPSKVDTSEYEIGLDVHFNGMSLDLHDNESTSTVDGEFTVNVNALKLNSHESTSKVESEYIASKLEVQSQDIKSVTRSLDLISEVVVPEVQPLSDEELKEKNRDRLYDYKFWCSMNYEEFCRNYPDEIEEADFLEYKIYNRIIDHPDPRATVDYAEVRNYGKQLSPSHFAEIRSQYPMSVIRHALKKIICSIQQHNTFLYNDFMTAFKWILRDSNHPTYNVLTDEDRRELSILKESKRHYYYDEATAVIWQDGKPREDMIDYNNEEQIRRRFEYIQPGQTVEEFKKTAFFKRTNKTVMNTPGETDPARIIKRYAKTKEQS